MDGTIWNVDKREIHNTGVSGRNGDSRHIGHKERWYEIDERTREVSDGSRNWWKVVVEKVKDVRESIVKRKTCA